MELKEIKVERRIRYKDALKYKMRNKRFMAVQMKTGDYAIVFTRVLGKDESELVTDEVIAQHKFDERRQYYRRCGITIAKTVLYLTEEGFILLSALTHESLMEFKILEGYVKHF